MGCIVMLVVWKCVVNVGGVVVVSIRLLILLRLVIC